MTNDCLFCKIAAGDIPCEKIYDHELFMAFKDIAPKAPVHVLVIPKKHIESLGHAWSEDAELLGRLTLMLPEIAKKAGCTDGFRTIINTGKGGGQEVGHLHYHILGGGALPGF
jgi:histidine triad (HIT) family protein